MGGGGAGDETQPPAQAEDGQRQRGGEPETDRSPQASGAASGGQLTSQLCHRPAGRAWERLPLLPCLSFPVYKARSQLQTHAFIILSAAVGAGTLKTSHVSALSRAPCRALPGGGARERLTGGRRETDEPLPVGSPSACSFCEQRPARLLHPAPVTKPGVQPLPTSAELARGHAAPHPPLLQTV